MGGYGSTRWRGYRRKTTVEECFVLSIGDLLRRWRSTDGELAEIRWITRPQRKTVGYASSAFVDRYPPFLWFYFGHSPGGESVTFEQRMELESTICNPHGGERWWFHCPLEDCDRRRCGKLYLQPGYSRFACRECRGLTYRSCRTAGPNAKSLLVSATRHLDCTAPCIQAVY